MGVSRGPLPRKTGRSTDERRRSSVLAEVLALNERMEAGRAELAEQIAVSNRLRAESWDREAEPTKLKRRA